MLFHQDYDDDYISENFYSMRMYEMGYKTGYDIGLNLIPNCTFQVPERYRDIYIDVPEFAEGFDKGVWISRQYTAEFKYKWSKVLKQIHLSINLVSLRTLLRRKQGFDDGIMTLISGFSRDRDSRVLNR